MVERRPRSPGPALLRRGRLGPEDCERGADTGRAALALPALLALGERQVEGEGYIGPKEPKVVHRANVEEHEHNAGSPWAAGREGFHLLHEGVDPAGGNTTMEFNLKIDEGPNLLAADPGELCLVFHGAVSKPQGGHTVKRRHDRNAREPGRHGT